MFFFFEALLLMQSAKKELPDGDHLQVVMCMLCIVRNGAILPIGAVWGKETDYNIFQDSISLKAAWSRRTDKHSVCGYLHFVDPENGDFRLKDGSIAFTTGFKNFTMDSFVLCLRC